MTDTQALRDLLVKVEAGKLPPTKLIVQAFGCRRLSNGWDVSALIKWIMGDTIEAMGAAKALHEAVLPEWIYLIGSQVSGVSMSDHEDPRWWNKMHNGNPASGWLIAILRALIAQATP